jgi:hypothetical protein
MHRFVAGQARVSTLHNCKHSSIGIDFGVASLLMAQRAALHAIKAAYRPARICTGGITLEIVAAKKAELNAEIQAALKVRSPGAGYATVPVAAALAPQSVSLNPRAC